jgi:signal transduction histidine kinase
VKESSIRLQTLNLLVILLLFSIPIFSLTWIYYSDRNEVLSFSKKELVGLNEISEKLSQISNLIKTKKSENSGLTHFDPESEKLFFNLEDQIEQISRNSNLILDPDVDSYYLISSQTDVLVMLAKIIIQTENFDRQDIIHTLLKKLSTSFQIAVDADSKFYGSSDVLVSAKIHFDELTKTKNINQFTKKNDKLGAFSYILNLQQIYIEPIHDLLQKRVDSIEKRTQNILLVSCLLWFLATIISFWTYNSSILSHQFFKLRIQNQDEALKKSAKLSLVGEMAGNIGHEIASPLTVIAGLAHKLKRDYALGKMKTEDIEVTTNKIIKMVNRINSMIKSIKAQVHQQDDLPSVPVALSEVIEDSFVMAELKIKYNDITISLEAQKDVEISTLKVLGVEFEITQVLTNLLSNAIDELTQQENIEHKSIILSVDKCERNNSNVIIIKVTDNGKGVPEELREKIFDPLFTTKKVGTGLGLAISRKIIERHGGTLTLLNTPEIQGACFEVILHQTN